ncbi:MAG: Mrp/NBP35 family ATP-binding protein [Sulfurimonas sp.]|jgi:ATP-binding protein involved in chromosome partitioning|uniref:Mrp/NBP35 family ATP-binding protein n=1 Tax=Sulfurimonas sp. TaxID=2022749 RepID=UPI0008BDBAC8|nr:Mrp/NBP35 family ATP-binding protein [Sulfurimonas sp.]MDD3854182.1 Mrp/NBP35 family ATP-binding protein [Sulfurimonas sp.]MDX9757357.1 Mrp/NBP35 family ATP-binding protein [Sulfurimonas sp.]OHE11522.1 MAG: sodium:proton antiporter [Sulfurimonas sp. RIFOXYC2_FULL_36_7]
MTKDIVNSALSKVLYPGFTKDIVTFGFVNSIEISGNDVSFNVEITSSAPEVAQQITDDATKELKAVGAGNISVNIKAPKMPEAPKPKSKNIAPHIKNFLMVSSGKGGVGKSTTSVNIAIALAAQGKKVGLLDADIYGPNIPRMMGIADIKPEVTGNKVLPIKAYGIEVMSMGSLMEPGQSLMWRGAMIMKAIEQFLRDILWSDLDVLVIDMPPGTGDAQLTLAQSVPVTAGLTVTTPQGVSLDDSRRSLDMFKKLNIPIAGVIENMSGFIAPDTGVEYDIFGKGTSEPMAKEFGTKVIAEIPIEQSIRTGGDEGKPITFVNPTSESAKRYMAAAESIWATIEAVNAQGGASNESVQPTTPPGVSACSTKH